MKFTYATLTVSSVAAYSPYARNTWRFRGSDQPTIIGTNGYPQEPSSFEIAEPEYPGPALASLDQIYEKFAPAIRAKRQEKLEELLSQVEPREEARSWIMGCEEKRVSIFEEALSMGKSMRDAKVYFQENNPDCLQAAEVLREQIRENYMREILELANLEDEEVEFFQGCKQDRNQILNEMGLPDGIGAFKEERSDCVKVLMSIKKVMKEGLSDLPDIDDDGRDWGGRGHGGFGHGRPMMPESEARHSMGVFLQNQKRNLMNRFKPWMQNLQDKYEERKEDWSGWKNQIKETWEEKLPEGRFRDKVESTWARLG